MRTRGMLSAAAVLARQHFNSVLYALTPWNIDGSLFITLSAADVKELLAKHQL